MQCLCHLSVLIYEQAKKYGNKVALSYPVEGQKKWSEVTWNEFSEKVRAVSNAFLALDVKVQENVGVFSQNMPQYLYTNFGLYGIRAVNIPFYATNSEQQVMFMVNDADVRILFVGEQQQYDTAFRVLGLCPTLEKLIIYDKSVKRNPQDKVSIYFDEFLKMGENFQHTAELEARMKAASLEDTADILYTSGTTGNSKGVVLSYEQYYEALRGNHSALSMSLSDKDVVMNFLPFTHIFERGWAYLCLSEGAQLAINIHPADILKSLAQVHPTCMSSVPRFWEKVYAGVQEKINSSNGVTKKMILEALAVGKKYNVDYVLKGEQPPLGLRLKYKVFEKTAIALLKKTLGLDRANIFPTAGAAIPPQIEEFVHSAGINMIAGYGLTESLATVSCDIVGMPKTIGSIGRPIKGLEIKFGENNEILLRGKTITKGYYHRDDVNRKTFDADGFFHTGDAGYMKDGELFMTERLKDLFKTSNGKYIAPQILESKLVVDRYIDQISIIADQRKFVSALVIPEYKLVEEYAREKGIDFADRADLLKKKEIIDLFTERINTLQQEFASYEKIKRFTLLPEPFSMERGELTNTLKVKRPVLYKNYCAEIDEMYRE